MFTQGLSLDQAPPIGVVLRFFLSVPAFGMLFAGMLFTGGSETITAHTPFMLAALHLFFLGVVAMAMFGALFQMLPVLAGVAIRTPVRHGLIVHALLVAGILMLTLFFFTFAPVVAWAAIVLLAGAIGYTGALMLPPLLRQASPNATVRGMQTALVSLMFAALLASAMLYGYGTSDISLHHDAFRTLHYTLALAGWVAFLIMSVAFQVIEMFYVTPPYPALLTRTAWLLFGGAVLLKALLLTLAATTLPADLAIAAVLVWFAVTTLKRLSQRRRPIADATVWFWRLGIVLLILSVLFWVWSRFGGGNALQAPALIAFSGFALSIIIGMLYKIVPFLVWFHLSSQGFFDAPLMNEIIPQRSAQYHFFLYMVTVALFMVLPYVEILLPVASSLAFGVFAWLGYNMIAAASLYDRIHRSKDV